MFSSLSLSMRVKPLLMIAITSFGFQNCPTIRARVSTMDDVLRLNMLSNMVLSGRLKLTITAMPKASIFVHFLSNGRLNI